jgi:hypothetical protein
MAMMVVNDVAVVRGHEGSPTLAEAEATIERGISAYWAMGRAMKAIKDGKLYEEAGYPDFATYCTGRWGYRQAQVYNLMAGAEVVRTLSTIVESPAPATESQARELVPLRDQPDVMVEVWKGVTAEAQAEGRTITAAMIKEAVETRLPPKPSEAKRRQEVAARKVRVDARKAMGKTKAAVMDMYSPEVLAEGERRFREFTQLWFGADEDTRWRIRQYVQRV